MGLFTEASVKAHSADIGGEEPALSVEAPLVSAAVASELVVAPELESSLDVLWARMRGRPLDGHGSEGQVFVLAHWEPCEGATTLALALAYRAAHVDAACTFCLADFDLFGADLSFLTDLEAESGISNVLLGQTSLEEALAHTTLPNLSVLPAGYPTVGRHVLGLWDRCRELCEVLTERFDYVLLDMPCLRTHPNFAFWTSSLARAVLVARAGQARRPTVAKALGTLQLMRLNVAGVVLNAREFYVPGWLYART